MGAPRTMIDQFLFAGIVWGAVGLVLAVAAYELYAVARDAGMV